MRMLEWKTKNRGQEGDYEAESFPRGFETTSWILPEPRTVPVSVKARECLSGSDLNLECG